MASKQISQYVDYQKAPISQFIENERFSATVAPSPGLIFSLPIPRGLPERRIYSYIDTISTPNPPGDVTFYCEVSMLLEGFVIGQIPVNFATWTANKTKSLASLLNSGGTPVGDTLVLNLAILGNLGVRSVALQPFRINAQIDQLQFHLINAVGAGLANVTGYQFYLACVSTSF